MLELACGLSPRGFRFTRKYGGRIRYVEADLPAMAARKKGSVKTTQHKTAPAQTR